MTVEVSFPCFIIKVLLQSICINLPWNTKDTSNPRDQNFSKENAVEASSHLQENVPQASGFQVADWCLPFRRTTRTASYKPLRAEPLTSTQHSLGLLFLTLTLFLPAKKRSPFMPLTKLTLQKQLSQKRATSHDALNSPGDPF